MANVLVVGLNPSWQKVLECPSFRSGEVNRARKSTALASGKGINAAKVLKRLGHDVSILQILGGQNGRRCLEGCQALGLRSLHVTVEEETRECLTMLDGDNEVATEIIEPFRIELPGIQEMLLAKLPKDNGAFDALIFCGTVPPGVPADIYGEVLARLQPRIAVLDAWQGMSGEMLSKVNCVKINRAEYLSLQGALSEAEGAGAGEAIGKNALIFVTDGAGEASLLNGGEVTARFLPPPISAAVNPIGAGDTVTAGLTHYLLEGAEPVEAFRKALALGSASCLTALPADYRDQDFQDLLPKAVARPLGNTEGTP